MDARDSTREKKSRTGWAKQIVKDQESDHVVGRDMSENLTSSASSVQGTNQSAKTVQNIIRKEENTHMDRELDERLTKMQRVVEESMKSNNSWIAKLYNSILQRVADLSNQLSACHTREGIMKERMEELTAQIKELKEWKRWFLIMIISEVSALIIYLAWLVITAG